MLRGLLNAACRAGAAVGQACPGREEKEQPWWRLRVPGIAVPDQQVERMKQRFVEVESVQGSSNINCCRKSQIDAIDVTIQ